LIWDLLAPQLPAGQLQKVGVIETRDNYFEYSRSANQGAQLTGESHG
jgi:6-pyruvoyltetrahydropterin/6-carboxytetrahydropterin synthase